MTYSIIRFYAEGHDQEVVEMGLTREEAEAHCEDTETSSRTCTTDEGCLRTAEMGDWFEGFREED